MQQAMEWKVINQIQPCFYSTWHLLRDLNPSNMHMNVHFNSTLRAVHRRPGCRQLCVPRKALWNYFFVTNREATHYETSQNLCFSSWAAGAISNSFNARSHFKKTQKGIQLDKLSGNTIFFPMLLEQDIYWLSWCWDPALCTTQS